MAKGYLIKNATVRKVRNRGFEPVHYHHAEGIASGWIYKIGRKWMWFYSASTGNRKLLLTERRYMRAV